MKENGLDRFSEPQPAYFFVALQPVVPFIELPFTLPV